MTTPKVTDETIKELIQIGVDAAIASSNGRLTDFAPGSPALVIIEGIVKVASRIQGNINELAASIEKNRLALFGIERKVGDYAVGIVKVTLSGLYTEPFQLPSGFGMTIAGIPFETVEDLTIPAYTQSGEVAISAIEPGASGNVPANSQVFYDPPERVSTITMSEPTAGGRDSETEQQWEDRVREEIRRRDVLISEEDFEQEAIDQLGEGSAAVAIGRLKPDRVNYDNGYVSVFAINPDGSSLNSAQLTQLQEALNRKAAMALVSVGSLDLFEVDVGVYASFNGNAQAIANEIYKLVSAYLKPGNLPSGSQILHKSLERRVQDVLGIKEGVVAVTLNGFEQPQSLPSPWSVANPRKISVKLNDEQGNEFDYDFLYGT
ncbi:MAG: hypothetical protein F6K65_22130 [Moorea sp. SIO3C2]|nr:hypothetical protein [Moorena sp. SIO3C2]